MDDEPSRKCLERRGWDSNPRGYYPYTISSRARSTGLCHLSNRLKAKHHFNARRTARLLHAPEVKAAEEQKAQNGAIFQEKPAESLIAASPAMQTRPEAWETAGSAEVPTA